MYLNEIETRFSWFNYYLLKINSFKNIPKQSASRFKQSLQMEDNEHTPICRITAAKSTPPPVNIDLNESVSSIILLDSLTLILMLFMLRSSAEKPKTRSAACTFNPDFLAPTSPPRTFLCSDDDESDEEMNMINLFQEWYGDLYREGVLIENIPRWRRYYDQTGRFDIKFRGATRLGVGMRDVRRI